MTHLRIFCFYHFSAIISETHHALTSDTIIMFGQYLLLAMMIIITLISITIIIDMIICILTIEVGNRSDQVQTRNSQIYNDRVLYREIRRVKQSDKSTTVQMCTFELLVFLALINALEYQRNFSAEVVLRKGAGLQPLVCLFE